ncbi:MAG: GIY-YIG nuclease family protein [Candidatus Bathyarchaeota archaeon]|nr:GIY-YIG nuclease family protein [Candidatus Bathyarchaeota archaeon]
MSTRIIRRGLRWKVDGNNLNDVSKASGVYALHYYGKRRYVGKSKNLQRRLKQHYRDNVTFTELTWYETTHHHRHSLERDLIDKDFEELWNEISGSYRKKQRR